MDIYAAAEAQGQAARGVLEYVEVPQWEIDGEPAKVYFYTGLDVEEYIVLSKHVEVRQVADKPMVSLTPEGVFECCRYLLRDASGARLFHTDARYRRLREKYDPKVLVQILDASNLLDAFLKQESTTVKKP